MGAAIPVAHTRDNAAEPFHAHPVDPVAALIGAMCVNVRVAACVFVYIFLLGSGCFIAGTRAGETSVHCGGQCCLADVGCAGHYFHTRLAAEAGATLENIASPHLPGSSAGNHPFCLAGQERFRPGTMVCAGIYGVDAAEVETLISVTTNSLEPCTLASCGHNCFESFLWFLGFLLFLGVAVTNRGMDDRDCTP